MEMPFEKGSPDPLINFPPLPKSLLFIFVILKGKGTLKEHWEPRRIMVHAYLYIFFSELYVLRLNLSGNFCLTVALKKEAVNYSENSIISYETIGCHNPAECNQKFYRRKDLEKNSYPWFRTACLKKEFCFLHFHSYKTDGWVHSDSMYDLSICGVGWTHASQRDI